MTQRDVIHHDILHLSLIHHLEGQSAAPHTGAVGDGDITVAAVRLGTQFDTSAHPVHLFRHIGTVEEGAQLIPRHDTVGDEDMLAEHRFFQGVRALQHDSVVMRGVHLRIAHGDILTAVDVDAVAVGIDRHIIDRADITSRDDNGEMSTPKDGDITDGDVPALLQGDGLVTGADGSALHVTGPLGVVACQSFTVNHPITANADVLLSFSPDQRIMEIGMSSILVFGCAEHLTLIIDLHLCRCRQDLGSRHQVQVNMTLQADTATEIHALR